MNGIVGGEEVISERGPGGAGLNKWRKSSRLKKKLNVNECFVDDGCHLGNG